MPPALRARLGGLLPRLLVGLSAGVLAALVLVRFIGLDRHPPGFYVDEAAIAAQVICLRQTGADADGTPWPLFAPVLGGGQASPPTLYLGAAWTALFGDSVASFRGFAAAAGLVILLSVAVTVQRLAPGTPGLWLGLLVAASSPWLFHLSRVFWDPIVAAALWAAALATYFQLTRQPPGPPPLRAAGWLAFGLLSLAAAYAYPPVRVQVVLSWALLAAFDSGWSHRRGWTLAAITAGLLAWPLLQQYGDPGFRARSEMLAIWNAGWLERQGKTLADLPAILLQQIGAHLDPRYWLFQGDRNLRHGSGYGGLLGPVELTILATTIVVGGLARREVRLLLALSFVGLLPAALTWEGTPHALRSLAATGPWLMAVGLLAADLTGRVPALKLRLLTALSLMALLGALLYGADYRGRYTEVARPWFDANAQPLTDRHYPALARRYFRLREGASCATTHGVPAR